VKNVLVVKRTGGDIAMTAGRDQWLADLADKQSDSLMFMVALEYFEVV
jgi:hypothetical protein